MSENRRSSTTFGKSAAGGRRQHASRDYNEHEAAYTSVLSNTDECIHTRQELTQVLQFAGKNPTAKQINTIWASCSGAIDFEEFCRIAKEIKPTSKSQLLMAFRKIDINGDGYISEAELYRLLTSGGEKMTHSEVKKVLDTADLDRDGKLDYEEFSAMMVATCNQCMQLSLQKTNPSALQHDYRDDKPAAAKRASNPRPSSAIRRFDSESQSDGKDTSSSQLSVRQRSSVSSRKEIIAVQKFDDSIRIRALVGSDQKSIMQRPKSLKGWNHSLSKGCFFLDENNVVISHIYTLELPFASDVWLTVKPFLLSKAEEKPKSNVDVGVFLLRESEVDGDDKLLYFTEGKDDQQWYWRGDLRSGTYKVVPFTSGCRFKPRSMEAFDDIQLVRKDQHDEVQLSRAFRECLSDIFEICDLDGNGLLSRDEFNFYQITSSDEAVDDEAWQVVLDTLETKNGEITREGFVRLHLMQAQEEESDVQTELMEMVKNIGFNGNLDMDQACPFEVNVFTKDSKAELHVDRLSSSDDNPTTEALIESVVSKNNTHTLKHNDGLLWHIYASNSRVATVLENKTSRAIQSQVNCSSSKNCMTQKTKNSFVVRIPAHSKTLVDQAVPAVDRDEWIYHCSISNSSQNPSKPLTPADRPSSSRKNSTLLSIFD